VGAWQRAKEWRAAAHRGAGRSYPSAANHPELAVSAAELNPLTVHRTELARSASEVWLADWDEFRPGSSKMLPE